jgi:hypothetical protein
MQHDAVFLLPGWQGEGAELDWVREQQQLPPWHFSALAQPHGMAP